MKTCTACGKVYSPSEFAQLEPRGYVGHWRAHGKLYAVELRQCPAPCNGTMGVEVENPPVNGTEEVATE